MITMSVRGLLMSRSAERRRVTDITIPDWDQIPQLLLLGSVAEYDDSAFNYHLLDKLVEEIDIWRSFEESRGDPGRRIEKIDEIRDALVEAQGSFSYVVFLGHSVGCSGGE